jgi:uncharacterized caspase-like protein
VEVEGHNFFLPSDVPYIQFGRQEQLKRESLSIDELVQDLHGRAHRVTVLILDACRENPLIPPEFKTTAEHGGLEKIEPPEGTFNMYSAAAHETALDRLSNSDPVQHSVYMRALLKLLKTKRLSLPDFAQELRIQVRELAMSVGHVQRPAYYDGVIGRFCLNGCNDGRTGPSVGLAIPSDPAKAWAWFRDTRSEEALLAYIDKFPDTEYSYLAARRLDLIQRQATTLHVISIGINDYADSRISRIKYASQDALAFAEAIKKSIGPSYRTVEVQVLADRDATKGNILKALESARSSAHPQDTVVVFLSGIATEIDGQPSYVPTDATLGNNHLFDSSSLVPITDIQRAIATIGRRLLFLDTGGIEFSTLSDVRADQITVLGAAQPQTPALELDQFHHGAFTYALLKGLSGEADSRGERTLSIQDLGAYVLKEVPGLTNGTQTPFFFTDEPNTILADLMHADA